MNEKEFRDEVMPRAQLSMMAVQLAVPDELRKISFRAELG
jgi:hypothetical protein